MEIMSTIVPCAVPNFHCTISWSCCQQCWAEVKCHCHDRAHVSPSPTNHIGWSVDSLIRSPGTVGDAIEALQYCICTVLLYKISVHKIWTHARTRARTHTHAHMHAPRTRTHNTHTHTVLHSQTTFYRWACSISARTKKGLAQFTGLTRSVTTCNWVAEILSECNLSTTC